MGASWTPQGDGFTVAVAATNAAGDGFDITYLGSWRDSWQAGVADPDAFVASSNATGALVPILFDGVGSPVWRNHDGAWVDLVRTASGLAIRHQAGLKPNRRYGPWYNRKPEGSLNPEHYGFADDNFG